MTDFPRYQEGGAPRPPEAPGRGPDAGDEKSPEELEHEIAMTRERLSRDIEAIGEKLSPENLREHAVETVKGAARDVATGARDQVREAGLGMVDLLRRNPWPAAVIGAGMTWLVIESAQRPGRRRRYQGEELHRSRMFGRGRSSRGALSTATDRGRKLGEQAQGRVEQIGSEVREKAGHIGSEVRDKAEQIGSEIRERTQEWGDQAREQAGRARRSVQSVWQERPLAVGVVAMALGVAAGVLAPRTRREDRLMGRARDDLLSTAQQAARQTKEVVAETARRVSDTVENEVKDPDSEIQQDVQGAVESVKQTAKRAAQEAKATAKSEVRKRNPRS